MEHRKLKKKKKESVRIQLPGNLEKVKKKSDASRVVARSQWTNHITEKEKKIATVSGGK